MEINDKNYTPEQDDESEIDLGEIFAYLLHWIWLLIICGLVAGGIGLAICVFAKTPLYQSTTKVYILSKTGNNESLTYSDTQLSINLTKDFKEMITSRYVLETVIENCGLSENYEALAGAVTISNTSDTRIVGITVKDADPARAQLIANNIRDVAAVHLQQVMNLEAVNVVEYANLADKPSEPSKKKYTILGFAIGFILCAGILVIRFFMDDSIKSSEEVEKYLGLTTLGVIPLFGAEEDDKKKKKKIKKEARG